MKRKISAIDIVVMIILILIVVITLYPFIYTIVGSFNSGKDFELGGVWIWPREWTFDNYKVILNDSRFWIALRNTVIRTGVGSILALLFTSLVAYAMSHPKLPCKKFFKTASIVTMYFSGGIVPFFVLVNAIGLYDNFLVYILPSLYSVYNMIVISKFFNSIDEGIREAAHIDGASEFRIWWQIYLPMSVPVMITVGMWIVVMHWNSYLPTLLYTSKDPSLWTLQYYLMVIIKDASLPDSAITDTVTAQSISFAGMVLSMLPIALIYPFLSKKFTNNSAGIGKD